MKVVRGISLGLWLILLTSSADAVIRKVRLTEFASDDFMTELSQAAGVELKQDDFQPTEKFAFKNMTFFQLDQLRGGKKVEGASLRIWIAADNSIIAAEGYIDSNKNKSLTKSVNSAVEPYLAAEYLADVAQLKLQESLVRESMRDHADAVLMDFSHEDRWKGQDFQRVFTAQGKRGIHTIRFSHEKQKVIDYIYREFSLAEELEPVNAMAFKVYEESEDGKLLEPEQITLKHLYAQTVAADADPYAGLTEKLYLMVQSLEYITGQGGPASAATWSVAATEKKINELEAAAPKIENGFAGPQGLTLDGRFVNVTVHPAVRFMPDTKELAGPFSAQLLPVQLTTPQGPGIQLFTHTRGKTFFAAEDLLTDPVRHPRHNLEALIDEGHDQVQVYWAVTEMMEQLQSFGFTDPDISTTPFQAILYNPDPSMVDNAFYVNNTINFATYSPDKANLARNNPTIWHELGHGLVDRIMGLQLALAKTQGFQEGMADFFGELIVQATSFGEDFPGRTTQRIYNKRQFGMFNEVHAAGMPFGGFMKGILDLAAAKWGKDGVTKTGDLVLEAMRFTRNHPALDEQEWVEKLRYVDSRGSEVREAGSFNDIITEALVGRNFTANGQGLAKFDVSIGGKALADSITSINDIYVYPLGTPRQLGMKVRITDGEDFRFNYPVRVVVTSAGGPFQGIDWVDEEIIGRRELVVKSSGEEVNFPIAHRGTCDYIAGAPAGCQDALIIQIYEAGAARPVGHKNAYVNIKPTARVPMRP